MIGGVITSTLLTLLVIPTVYEILADSRDWLAAKLFGRSKRPRMPRAPDRHDLTIEQDRRTRRPIDRSRSRSRNHPMHNPFVPERSKAGACST